MKHALLLCSFAFSVSAFAQSPVNITTSQYATQKQNGTLDLTKNYHFTDAPAFTPVHYSGPERTPSSICSCMLPLDSTYTMAMGPNDDLYSNIIGIPFVFNFYGVNYNSLYINNNGNISFGTPYSTFTANPFPDPSHQVIAPFWGDVDTRDSLGGAVYFKISPTHMIIKWEAVGYYNVHSDKLNTFQLIITNGTDTLLPAGTNVGFCYSDMQWTTGDASGGVGGFGGAPATVGNNMGNGVDYFQAGTFNQPGVAFDGPYAAADGIDWLDDQGMYFDASLPGNVPPVIINNNICDTIDVFTGDTLRMENLDYATFSVAATTPEISQNVNVTITCSEPAALTYTQPMNTPTYKKYDCTFSAIDLTPGLYYVTITATDDGVPAETTTSTIVIRTSYDASVMTGITEKNTEEQFSIYPNPSNGTITVNHKINAASEPFVNLSDVLGKTVMTRSLNSASQQIDISALPQGIYFATIISKEGKGKTMKIVKK
jgi:hypothetical protein